MIPLRRFNRYLQTPTIKLASTYLSIIMLMSIGFSIVVYNTSSRELGRQIPPDSFFTTQAGSNDDDNTSSSATEKHTPPPGLDAFLENRIDEGRKELFTRLLLVNTFALLAGSEISYMLARRTLKPIEEAMEAQVQFVSDASHELRTPLTVIQATNEVALRDKKLTLPTAKEVIRSNTEEAIKMSELSDGLLRLARQDTAHLELSDLDVQEITTLAINRIIQPAQTKNIALHDELPPMKVTGQAQALSEVLFILLENAVKYSNQNGNIYIGGHKQGNHGLITVRDEGIGIRASDLPHIFRRFYRADSVRTSGVARSGYGLGLSIAQKLIEQQHGTISVDSEPGKGTRFTVRLQLA